MGATLAALASGKIFPRHAVGESVTFAVGFNVDDDCASDGGICIGGLGMSQPEGIIAQRVFVDLQCCWHGLIGWASGMNIGNNTCSFLGRGLEIVFWKSRIGVCVPDPWLWDEALIVECANQLAPVAEQVPHPFLSGDEKGEAQSISKMSKLGILDKPPVIGLLDMRMSFEPRDHVFIFAVCHFVCIDRSIHDQNEQCLCRCNGGKLAMEKGSCSCSRHAGIQTARCQDIGKPPHEWEVVSRSPLPVEEVLPVGASTRPVSLNHEQCAKCGMMSGFGQHAAWNAVDPIRCRPGKLLEALATSAFDDPKD